MKLETKKSLAKEYLYFLSCIGTGILSFLFFTIYVEINGSELEKNTQEIERRKKLIYTYFSNDIWNRLNELVQKDSIRNRWNDKWAKNGLRDDFIKLGFKNPSELIEFSSNNSTTELEAKNNEILNKIYFIKSSEKRLKISFYLFLLIFSIIFPIRYLYFSIVNSLNLIKDK
ncbi:hypothetical protein [Algoriphagus marincola]|uniref:hypothetical protein n=1 Tax=Algoriphagus marincola TaxID=264027 RepID=UPI0004144546|nr:hypothetical protein [Algoriphagus marincola]